MLIDVMKYNLPVLLRTLHGRALVNACRTYQTGLGDDADKTTVEVLNKQLELGLMINAYSQVGFRLNTGISLLGSIAIFAQSVLSWRVASAREIDEKTLSLFYLLEPKVDILVIGYGNRKASGEIVSQSVISSLKHHRIFVELLPTDVSCTTYNMLVSERRFVAGAFIPPESIAATDLDIMNTKARNRMLEFDQKYD